MLPKMWLESNPTCGVTALPTPIIRYAVTEWRRNVYFVTYSRRSILLSRMNFRPPWPLLNSTGEENR